MKKTLLSIFVLASVFAVAQNKSVAVVKTKTVSSPVMPVGTLNATAASTTTVLQPASFATCTVTVYGAGADGYVAGTNAYGDLAKSQKFSLSTYSLTTPATSQAVGMYIAYATGTGSVTAKIYDDNAGAPGTLLGTSMPVGIATINTNTITPFVFSSAVNLTSTFHVALDFSTINAAAGDTVALAETEDGCAANTANGSYEQLSDNSWQPFTTASPAGWGFTSTDLGIFPQVTAEIVAGVKENSLKSNVSISPNPSNGLLNVSFSLTDKENLNITVANALGQTIISNNYNSIANDMISLDLSAQNNGVYFVTVSNGKDKMVKKVVLNK